MAGGQRFVSNELTRLHVPPTRAIACHKQAGPCGRRSAQLYLYARAEVALLSHSNSDRLVARVRQQAQATQDDMHSLLPSNPHGRRELKKHVILLRSMLGRVDEGVTLHASRAPTAS